MSITEILMPPESLNFVGDGDFREIGSEFLRHFIELGGLKPNESVLDVGCGIGRMAAPLTRYLDKQGRYEGFDIVSDGIDWSVKNIGSRFSNFRFQFLDIYNRNYNPKGRLKAAEAKFPYPSESFDFVFLTSVFTHMLPDEVENYLSEIARVMKSNARCLITYFLLNHESLELIGSKKSKFGFGHQFGSYRLQDLNAPEAAVSYEENFVQGLYRRYGLKINEPIRYGSWCGRSTFVSGQDIVVARKDPAVVMVKDNQPVNKSYVVASGSPKCSIIIPVYNHASLTRQCLNRILKVRPLDGDVEIIVIDDASTDITPPMLEGYGDEIRVLTHGRNSGFANACNDGAAVSSGEFLLFLNNDTVPEDGWLEALVKYAAAHPKAAAVGSKLLYLNDTVQHAGVAIGQDKYPRHIYTGFPSDHPAVNKSRRFQAVTAACLLARRGAFEEVGGFDAAFTNSYEDIDLCLRFAEKGYETHYCHESVLHHFESVSEGRTKNESANARLYHSRWGHRVHQDDILYFIEDGLLSLQYRQLYPITFSLSPLLGTVDGADRQEQADRLLGERSRQALEMLKENIQLRLLLLESQSGWETSSEPAERTMETAGG